MASSSRSSVDPPLSVTEKLSFQAKKLVALLASVKMAVLYPFLPTPRPSFKDVLSYAALRTLLKNATARQIKSAAPATADVYGAWAAQAGQAHEADEIRGPNGVDARILWVGRRWTAGSAGKVVLYAHGGGFQLPLGVGHARFCAWLQREMVKDAVEGAAVALLEYALTPEHRYPVPLHQAALALDHLLRKGLPPSSIVLAGDSAGGHIMLGVLSHLLHPHPSFPTIETLSAPLAAAILISPSVTSKTTAGSMRECNAMDMLDVALLSKWTGQFVDGTSFRAELAAGQYWGSALEAPPEWWAGLARVVRAVRVTTGYCEIFRDDNVAFVETLKRVAIAAGGSPAVENFVGQTEAHDAPLQQFSRRRLPSGSSIMVAEWCAQALK